MASNKIKGMVVVGSAIAGYMLLNNQGDSGESKVGGGTTGFVVVKKGESEPTTNIYNITEGSVNYKEGSNYVGAVASTPTKKSSSGFSSTNSNSYLPSVSSASDYNALPEGQTKKAFSSMYAPLQTSDGGTIQAPYGLGAGGTGIITPPPIKKTTEKPSSSWWKFW